MEGLLQVQEERTMSSREIAEYSGRRHADVMRDIRNLLSQLEDNFNERRSAFVKKSNDEPYHRGDRAQYKYLREDTQDYIFDYSFTNNGGFQFILSEYDDSKGEKRPEYLLTKKDTLLLISGYNPILRARIINRWEELEKKAATAQLPQTFADALRQLAEQVEESERQKQIIAEQKPKVLFADAVATSTHSCLVGELAKILAIK